MDGIVADLPAVMSEADVRWLVAEVMRRAGGALQHRMAGRTQELIYYYKLGRRDELDRLSSSLRAFVATGRYEDFPAQPKG